MRPASNTDRRNTWWLVTKTPKELERMSHEKEDMLGPKAISGCDARIIPHG